MLYVNDSYKEHSAANSRVAEHSGQCHCALVRRRSVMESDMQSVWSYSGTDWLQFMIFLMSEHQGVVVSEPRPAATDVAQRTNLSVYCMALIPMTKTLQF